MVFRSKLEDARTRMPKARSRRMPQLQQRKQIPSPLSGYETQNPTVEARKDSRWHRVRDHFSLALKHLNFMRSDTTFKR